MNTVQEQLVATRLRWLNGQNMVTADDEALWDVIINAFEKAFDLALQEWEPPDWEQYLKEHKKSAL